MYYDFIQGMMVILQLTEQICLRASATYLQIRTGIIPATYSWYIKRTNQQQRAGAEGFAAICNKFAKAHRHYVGNIFLVHKADKSATACWGRGAFGAAGAFGGICTGILRSKSVRI
jgi:hypothetical protein